MPNENVQAPCQIPYRDASTLVPKVMTRVYRFRGFLRKHGFKATVRKILTGLFPISHTRSREPECLAAPADETLDLRVGEWVEVKSYAEINRTLDGNQCNRGLLFMPEMEQYCGRKLQVLKTVSRILLEESGEVRRLRNTVLLVGATCSGLSVGCDRSCFHFWREAWLRRADGGASRGES